MPHEQGPSAASDTFFIHSARKHRAERAGHLQHVVAAVMLISNAWSHLTAPHANHYGHTALALLPYAEIAAAALLLAGMLVERIRHVRGHHSSLGWVEILGALMTLIEAIARLFEPHTTAFRVVSFIPPVILFRLGVFQVRMGRRYYFRVDADGFAHKLRFGRHQQISWQSIERYRIEPKALVLTRTDGTETRVPLTDVKNREDAVAWLEARFTPRRSARQE